MQGPEKNSYKEFNNEKKFQRLENSPPPAPHNFANGPSLIVPSSCLLYAIMVIQSTEYGDKIEKKKLK